MNAPVRRMVRGLARGVDRFLFEGVDARFVPPLRIAAALIVLIIALVWLRDADLWFTDAGVLTSKTAQHVNGHAYWSLLFLLPSTSSVVHAALFLLVMHSLLLLVGIASQIQMTFIFVWLVSFQHRNMLICDGEDTLLRWFIFLMIFLPLDCGLSLGRRLRTGSWAGDYQSSQAWALRLLQLQMTVIYASATYNKMLGQTWRDGTALFYVSHMTDFFGRTPWASRLYEVPWLIYPQTWLVLAIEGLLPVLLWIPRTRIWAVILGIVLHLGIELTMHLFLFEWIMIFGLVTFLASITKPSHPVFNGTSIRPLEPTQEQVAERQVEGG